MKTIKITILLFLCTFIMSAQEAYKHSLLGIKKVKIITNTGVDMTIGTSNQLVINNAKNKLYNYKKRKNKSKGLKALYSNGTDNTGLGFEVIKDGNTLIIKDLKSFMKRNGFSIQLPKAIDISLDCRKLGYAKITGISSDIEVKTIVGNIDLVHITGPVTASTKTGNITATFTTVNQNSPISIISTAGDVDVSISNNTKADLELKTITGTVYSNFEFKVESSKGLNSISPQRRIYKKLNNGGVKIYLRSGTGNVYLRKK